MMRFVAFLGLSGLDLLSFGLERLGSGPLKFLR
jgi:hypothetical protein